jgi:hypothetical protein
VPAFVSTEGRTLKERDLGPTGNATAGLPYKRPSIL